MNNKDLETMLKQTLQKTPPVAGGPSARLRHLAEQEAVRRSRRVRISFPRLLSGQMRFLGWKVWAAQGVLLLMAVGLVSSIYGQLFFINPHSVAKLLACLSVVVSMTALPFLYRSVRYRMQEVEAATYFSSVKLLAAKLAVIGLGDLLLLLGMFAAAVAQTSLEAGNAALYLCLPFLLVTGGGLFMLGHFSPRGFLAGSMAFGTLLILACVSVPNRGAWLFQQSFSLGWLAVCALLAVFCTSQCRYILYRSSYTEMQFA